ncbi:MAG: hypothetical protein ABJC62_08620, partial [Frankiaceae bacterium]
MSHSDSGRPDMGRPESGRVRSPGVVVAAVLATGAVGAGLVLALTGRSLCGDAGMDWRLVGVLLTLACLAEIGYVRVRHHNST